MLVRARLCVMTPPPPQRWPRRPNACDACNKPTARLRLMVSTWSLLAATIWWPRRVLAKRSVARFVGWQLTHAQQVVDEVVFDMSGRLMTNDKARDEAVSGSDDQSEENASDSNANADDDDAEASEGQSVASGTVAAHGTAWRSRASLPFTFDAPQTRQQFAAHVRGLAPGTALA